jgi:hypothetical protein
LDSEWISMQTLGTFGGAVMAVTMISQFFKGALDRWFRIPTRFLVLGISWGILFGRRYVGDGEITVDTAFVDLLNGVLVALTSMGAHAFAKDNLQWK